MTERNPDAVTLNTLHDDLQSGFGEMRAGFADLKATLVTGFRSLPSRESSEEMVRLLRESNRLQEERFTRLDLRTREQHLETQQVLHALVEGQRLLIEGQRGLVEGQRALVESQRALNDQVRTLSAEIRDLSSDIKGLIARIDALIKGRGNGGPTA